MHGIMENDGLMTMMMTIALSKGFLHCPIFVYFHQTNNKHYFSKVLKILGSIIRYILYFKLISPFVAFSLGLPENVSGSKV